MNFYKLLEETPNLNVTINSRQLKEAIDYCVTKTKEELKESIIDSNSETYYTIGEVTKILNVSTTTLWRWNRDGSLKHVSVGGKRKYRSCDIDKILKG